MILLDDDPQKQERSRNEQIRKLAGYSATPTLYASLPCDAAFYGFGDSRTPIMVGVEVKRAKDAADSFVRSGRLTNQLRRCAEYGFSALVVVIQDIVRPGTDGLLEMYGWVEAANGRPAHMDWVAVEPTITYRQWDNMQSTLESRGVWIKKTSNPTETAWAIVNLYHWWQKAPEEHQSLDRFYNHVQLTKDIGLMRKMAKELPGVGWDKSANFVRAYSGKGYSVLDVLNKPADDWAKNVVGVGKGISQTAYEDLHRVF